MYFDRLKSSNLVGLFASVDWKQGKILELRHTKSGSQRDWREPSTLAELLCNAISIEMLTLGRILQATADVANFFDFLSQLSFVCHETSLKKMCR